MRQILTLICLLGCCASCRNFEPAGFFAIRVVDEQTGRGVPLIEIRLPNEVSYWTDSAGIAALREPSFEGRRVFISIQGHGYEFPDKVLDLRGAFVNIATGQIHEIAVRRTMIAERLYRLTGEGIYRDSVLAGLPVPATVPLLNGQVLGQDTVVGTIYQGRIFWIWGDTLGPDYWNFSVAAATSSLQDDPDVAIHYDYFTNDHGQAKAMLPLSGGGLIWIEGLILMTDPDGRERLVATYTRQQGLKFPEECGLALFDDKEEVFQQWGHLPCTRHHKSSHPFLYDGYWYLYPNLRVRNDWYVIQDPNQWEKRQVEIHDGAKMPSCVVWNEHRQRWIALWEDFGNVYYMEATHPEGPYGKSVRIIHHDNYNFYNVATHTFLNQKEGQVIYLEGTYTDSFTKAPFKTPRYNYNQIMYRLDLNDPRLREAQANNTEVRMPLSQSAVLPDLSTQELVRVNP